MSRPLMDLGSKLIEEAIREAISALTKEQYDADIFSIDFYPSPGAALSDEVELRLKLRKKSKSDSGDSFFCLSV